MISFEPHCKGLFKLSCPSPPPPLLSLLVLLGLLGTYPIFHPSVNWRTWILPLLLIRGTLSSSPGGKEAPWGGCYPLCFLNFFSKCWFNLFFILKPITCMVSVWMCGGSGKHPDCIYNVHLLLEVV